MFSRTKLCISILALLAASVPAHAVTSAEVRSKVAQATHGFRDIILTCKVVSANQKELKKIGKDFGKTYEFKSTTVWYKAPDKMRVEGKLGVVKVAMVMTDSTKSFSVPALHIAKKENIKDDPHKRQTDFDIGLLTESLWQDYTVTDVDTESINGNAVYKITFVRENSRRKKHFAWVDADTLKLLKVEKFESDGRLICRFTFANHSRVGGIWIPTKLDVYSGSGKLAGTTAYENIKVNTDPPDSLFRL